MKNIVLTLLCLPLFGLGQQFIFEPYTTVSSMGDGYGRPRIVLTANNSPLIIWRKNSSPKVLRASKWDGNSFSPPYDILQAGILPSSWDGPEISSRGDTVYVVFTSLATSQSSIMLIKSFDGGLTFSDTIRVSENTLLHKYRMPNVDIKADGNPVVSYMQYLVNWMEPKQIVNPSFTFGDNFLDANEASLLAPGEPCDCCKSSLICSGNNMYLLFRNNDVNARNSYVSKSIDGGISFTSVVDIDDYSWMLNTCPSSTPRGVVVGDSLCVVRRSGASGNNEIVYNNVNEANLNFSYNRNIDFISGSLQDYPEITSSGDTIVVVWQDNRTGLQNCHMSYSFTGASNLSGSISFTDTSSFGTKIDPDVVFSNRTIHLVYLDYSQYSIVYTKAYYNETTNVNDLSNTYNTEIVYKKDLLGRKVNSLRNTPLFYIFDDGTVEKRIVIE